MPDAMNRPLVVINVVGLTYDMLGPDTPCLSELRQDGFARPMGTVLPAVTCSAQASLETGLLPAQHGIVANGWYFRDLSEVWLWRQSNRLMQGERFYDTARRRLAGCSVARLFWWYNMYADVDWSVTPRPAYPADGRKVMDSYSHPPELKDKLQSALGVFPLFKFWGPGTEIASSRWIAQAAVEVMRRFQPAITTVYLPHLDYNLQRVGPDHPSVRDDIQAVDAEAGRITQSARERGADVVVVSEYGITAVDRPVHINRALREAGLLTVRREITGWETLDCGASRAFAVADHQIAHVYVQNPQDIPLVSELLTRLPGVERVLDRTAQAAAGIDHERAGELVVVSDRRSWFTYYFWLDDRLAPDYARTVDIHRKPGYDPVELFVDPALRFPRLRVARRLVQKGLGFRYLMDVIGLDASLVKGSHGRLPDPGREASDGPVFLCSTRRIERDAIAMTDVKALLLELLGCADR